MACGQTKVHSIATRIPGPLSRRRSPDHRIVGCRVHPGDHHPLVVSVLAFAALAKPARRKRLDGLGQGPTCQPGDLDRDDVIDRRQFPGRTVRTLAEVSIGNLGILPRLFRGHVCHVPFTFGSQPIVLLFCGDWSLPGRVWTVHNVPAAVVSPPFTNDRSRLLLQHWPHRGGIGYRLFWFILKSR
jgi:hypothetical protein